MATAPGVAPVEFNFSAAPAVRPLDFANTGVQWGSAMGLGFKYEPARNDEGTSGVSTLGKSGQTQHV
jgi:hypothetical protein